jgi:glycosyltransferase involved in cell wall biosynthesis
MATMKQLRIAFLTPEFVTENENVGGIAAYVYRICKALVDLGHKPEVFTLSSMNTSPFDLEGIRVERVKPYESIFLKSLFRGFNLIFSRRTQRTYKNLCFALAVSQALRRRENKRHYDFVHSSDYYSSGLFVKKSIKRPLIVRSSWARDLWLKPLGLSDDFDEKCVTFMEKQLIRRSNIVYAPSDFVAKHYSKLYGLNVHTLRPPFLPDATVANKVPWILPDRFLLHFASILGPLKGTDILAKALPSVWSQEPDFTIVWAGREHKPGMFSEYAFSWGVHANKVIMLGEIRKPLLYAVLKKAEATVLPSRYDNLPNTAIESLGMKVPVIGPKSASFDELVEPGINGELFTPEDPVALAKVLLRVWRRQVNWAGKPYESPKVFSQMEPHIAASNLIRLVGRSLKDPLEYKLSVSKHGNPESQL